MKKQTLPINLQFFAEDDKETGGANSQNQDAGNIDANANEDVNKEKETQDTQKTYTQDEVEKLKQELSKEKDSEIQEAVQKALDEEKRKAKLTKDELEKEEKTKLLEEIETLKNEKQVSILKETALNKLLEEKLPNSFLKFVMGENEKVIAENITDLKTEFDKAVQAQVEERLKGKTPTFGSNITTDDEISKKFANALKGNF